MKRKLTSLLLAFAMIVSILPLNWGAVFADDYGYAGTYELAKEGTGSITATIDTQGNMVITGSGTIGEGNWFMDSDKHHELQHNQYKNIRTITFNNTETIYAPEDSSYMFASMNNLTSLDLGDKFDTSNVTNMRLMFSMLRSDTLDLGDKFDTSNVTNMDSMLYSAQLTSIDLGDKFDTSNVTNMRRMFYNMRNVTSLDLGNKFDTTKILEATDMFLGTTANIIHNGEQVSTDASSFLPTEILTWRAKDAESSPSTSTFNKKKFVIHKLQYNGEKQTTLNTGDEMNLEDFKKTETNSAGEETVTFSVEKYDKEKYGDVEFSLYKIRKDSYQLGSLPTVESLDREAGNTLETIEFIEKQTVNEDGIINFEVERNVKDDEQRNYYFIKETKHPMAVTQVATSMILAGPIDKDIHVYPKNKVDPVVLEVQIQHFDVNSGLDTDQATKTEDTTTVYDLYKDGTKINENDLVATLIDTKAIIKLENLTIGEYELKTKVDNEINQTLQFTVAANQTTGKTVIYTKKKTLEDTLTKDTDKNIYRTLIKNFDLPKSKIVKNAKLFTEDILNKEKVEFLILTPMTIDTIKNETFTTDINRTNMKFSDDEEIELVSNNIISQDTLEAYKADENVLEYNITNAIENTVLATEKLIESSVDNSDADKSVITTNLKEIIETEYPAIETLVTKNTFVKDIKTGNSEQKFYLVTRVRMLKPMMDSLEITDPEQEDKPQVSVDIINSNNADDENSLEVWSATIKKVNGLYGLPGDTSLAGAEFVLQNKDGQLLFQGENENTWEWKDVDKDFDFNGPIINEEVGIYPKNEAGNEHAYRFISNDKGYVYIKGLKQKELKANNYTLIEVKAPEGYYLPNDRYTKLNDENKEIIKGENQPLTKVVNEAIINMPMTGSMKLSTVTTTAAGILASGFLILFLFRRKKKEQDEEEPQKQ